MHDAIRATDPEVAEILDAERRAQNETVTLIASENRASEAVLRAQGSVLTNQYAEGEPGDRYYAGCERVDELERLAVERARELWGADHVNVQPHSGTSANLAAYVALLEPGETILSLPIGDGGHLSHGHGATLPGQLYDVARYEVDPETGRLDYDAIRERAEAVDPDLVVAGYSAYPRQVDWERFRAIADAVDARLVADVAHLTGLVAAGLHPSPVGVADVVTGSTHKTIRAGRGGIVMTDDADLADDLDRAVFPGTQGGPLVHDVAGKAVGFGEALEPAFDEYARQVLDNAAALADGLRERGVELVSGGTDVHFALADLRGSHPDLTGKAAERALASAGIVSSASGVPGDERPPKVGSGVRLGTPAVTTRGFDETDCRRLADWIARVLDAPDDDAPLEAVRAAVRERCADDPHY